MSSIPLQTSIQRGEPFSAPWQLDVGDPTGVTVKADLKPTESLTLPDDSVASVASFVPSYQPAAGSEPAIWYLTLPASVTEGLQPGLYVFDARFMLTGETVLITEPVFLRVQQRVTAA